MNIDTPGQYRLSNGHIVEIHIVNGKGTFPVKGSWRPSKNHPWRYNIWTKKGKNQVLGESDLDIVRKIGGQ